MRYRRIARRGLEPLRVSELSLGTVSLGMPYGIAAPGAYGAPTERDAIRLLRHAAAEGVTLFDTAPGYGTSEELLGRALGRERACLFATKATVPGPGGDVEHALRTSVESSLRALRRDTIDILQLHNATAEIAARPEIAAVLAELRRAGLVRYLGASVYGEAAAMAVIEAGCFDLLQVAYSVLDQRMAARVFPAASSAGVGIIVRSALLKGVLSEKAPWVPDALAPIRDAAERVRDALAGSWDGLAGAALRFCLSAPDVSSVLAGCRTLPELMAALASAEAGALPGALLAGAGALGIDDERLLDPSRWPVA